MSQINANFVIDFALFLSVTTVAVQFVRVRVARESYARIRKYKPDTLEYRNLHKATSWPVLCTVMVACLLVGIRVGFDIHTILSSHDTEKYGFIAFSMLGVMVLYSLIAYILSSAFGISLRFGRERVKNKKPWLV